jgi:hypothetical protein
VRRPENRKAEGKEDGKPEGRRISVRLDTRGEFNT